MGILKAVARNSTKSVLLIPDRPDKESQKQSPENLQKIVYIYVMMLVFSRFEGRSGNLKPTLIIIQNQERIDLK